MSASIHDLAPIAPRRLLDHVRRLHEKRGRHGEVECLSGFDIDDELETGRLLDRQVSRPLALEYLVDIAGGTTPCLDEAWRMRHSNATALEGCLNYLNSVSTPRLRRER